MHVYFNEVTPFLDAEIGEYRISAIHPSISKNGVTMTIRKIPHLLKISEEKAILTGYARTAAIDILKNAVSKNRNIVICGETFSGKTELLKFLTSYIEPNKKIITIEDTLELHLDKIFEDRNVVSMKLNRNVRYDQLLKASMRTNPNWIMLSEVRSAEAVMAIRNSISSGHAVITTLHARSAKDIPHRMYSLLEKEFNAEQFEKGIHNYIDLGVLLKYKFDENGEIQRYIAEIVEFYLVEGKTIKKVIYKC